jgi:hypothetical protein
MSRKLPEKPNLEYLKNQAKELRSMQGSKLADAQHALANDYGFPTWANLKAHVQALGLSPTEALKAAVCDSDVVRVRELIQQHPELRARIDDPLPDYGFGQHALFAAVQRSDRATIDVLLRAGPTSRSGLSGGPADSAYWTIAIRAWWTSNAVRWWMRTPLRGSE